MNEPQVKCPLCGRRPPRFTGRLYDTPVCGRCADAFFTRRATAYLIDFFLYTVLFLALRPQIDAWISSQLNRINAGPALATAMRSWWAHQALFALAFTAKDGFWGWSPGKAMMGLRVVRADTQEPIGMLRSMQRNAVLALPSILPALWVLWSIDKGQRVGDGWAGTRVIWQRHRFSHVFGYSDRYCRDCGYDLTGNTSGVCPECGARIVRRSNRPAPPGGPSGGTSGGASDGKSGRPGALA